MLAVCAGTLSQQPFPTPSKTGNPPEESAGQTAQQTTNQQANTKKSPLFVELLNAGKSSDDTKAEAQKEEEKSSRERWLNIFTGIAASATAILAVITGLLAAYTYKLWSATSRLVEHSEDTAIRQLRAYVHTAGFDIDQFAIGKLIKISFPVSNCGQTPAHNVLISGWTGVRPYPPPSEWYLVPSGQEINSVMVCAPGDQKTRGTGVSETELSKVMFDQIISGTEQRLYAYAMITYRDVFSKKIRTTEVKASTGGPDFAASIQAALTAAKGQPGTATVAWQYSKNQNRAD